MFNEFCVSENNLINNIKQVKTNNPNSLICAMVKANAYGVGSKQVVKTICDYVDYFGVACFFEAENIRKVTNKSILIVAPVKEDEIKEDFSYACGSIEELLNFIKTDKPIKLHLKINTGMNRYGFKDIKKFKFALELIKQSKLTFEGLFTHFATADDFVAKQYKLFKKFVRVAKQFGFSPILHTDNSSVNRLFNHNLDMVRIGFDLYNNNENGFLSVVKIKSEVVDIQNVKAGETVGYNNRFCAEQDMKIAIVPVGYADGFDLSYIGIGLFVKNIPCKVLNVCMDCMMIDVSNVDIKKGDNVFILNNINSLTRYANYSNSSEYAVMCKFSHIRADRKCN